MSQLKAQIDKLLTNVSSAYIPTGLICENVLPQIGVSQYSGKLGKYGNSHLRIENTIVGGRGQYRRVEPITRTTSTYIVEGHGLEGMVTKQDRANYDKPFDAESDEVLGLTSQLLVEKEYTLASTVTNTGIITQNVTLAGQSQFSDYLNSDPIARFTAARKAVRDGSGAIANAVMMDWEVADKLRYHPQILDSLGFKDNRPGGLNDLELASALGVRRVLIAEGMYNSAKEGQTDVLAALWGKHVVFAVLPEKAQPFQVSLGYRIQINGSAPRKVYKYDVNNPPESMGILVEDEYDMFISNANAAYLIKNAIA